MSSLILITGTIDQAEDPFHRLDFNQLYYETWKDDPDTKEMWKETERRAAVEAEYGGPVAENIDLQYTLSTAEKQYLASLGVDAEQLLAYMNTRTNITADRAARIHAEHWEGFSGAAQASAYNALQIRWSGLCLPRELLRGPRPGSRL